MFFREVNLIDFADDCHQSNLLTVLPTYTVNSSSHHHHYSQQSSSPFQHHQYQHPQQQQQLLQSLSNYSRLPQLHNYSIKIDHGQNTYHTHSFSFQVIGSTLKIYEMVSSSSSSSSSLYDDHGVQGSNATHNDQFLHCYTVAIDFRDDHVFENTICFIHHEQQQQQRQHEQEFYCSFLTKNEQLYRLSLVMNMTGGSQRNSFLQSLIDMPQHSLNYWNLVLTKPQFCNTMKFLMDKNQLVIGCTNGSMVHLHLHQYQIKEQEWRMESRIGRYFSLFSSNVNKPSSIVALEVLRTSLDGDILVICLCYDATVRIWSVKSQSCTRIQCLVDRYRVEAEEPISFIGGKALKLYETGGEQYLLLHYSRGSVARFETVQLRISEADNVQMFFDGIKYAPSRFADEQLVDFCVNNGDTVMGLWVSKSSGTYYVAFGSINDNESVTDEEFDSHRTSWRHVYTLVDDFERVFSSVKITNNGKRQINDIFLNDRMINKAIIQRVLFPGSKSITVSRDELKQRIQHLNTNQWIEILEGIHRLWMEHNLPLGITQFNDKKLGLVSLNGMTCLRECDSIEMLYVQGQLKTNFDSPINMVIDNILFVSHNVGADKLDQFESLLNNNEKSYNDFLQFANSIADGVSSNNSVVPVDPEFMIKFAKRIMCMKNPKLVSEIIALLNITEAITGAPHSLQSVDIQSRLVTTVCSQMLRFRFELSRDLFLLLSLLIKCRSNILLDWVYRIQFDLVDCHHIYEILRAYHKIYWLSTQSVHSGSSHNPAITGHVTFLELFYSKLVPAGNSPSKIIQHLWFLGSDAGKINALKIAKMLLDHHNEVLLKEFAYKLLAYVPHLHHYIALCYEQKDSSDELAREAKKHIIEAGVAIADPTKQLISKEIFGTIGLHPVEPESFLFHYYKYACLRLKNNPRVAIEVGSMAIREAEFFDGRSPKGVSQEDVAVLHSVIFNYHLTLEEYDEAYSMLTLHPDPSRRVSDLTHFVIVLCDSKVKGKSLRDYPFTELVQDVEQCLLNLARVSVVSDPLYYKTLYAFYTYRKKFDLAAACMYELAQRMTVDPAKHFKEQAMCYVMAINSLKCLPTENHQFIKYPIHYPTRRVQHIDNQTDRLTGMTSVVTVQELEKLYLLAKANEEPQHLLTMTTLSSEDIGRIKRREFGLALAIADRSDDASHTYCTFLLTRLTRLCIESEGEVSTDYWQLLEQHLCSRDHLHDAYAQILSLILEHNVEIPHWLRQKMEAQCPSELLRVFCQFDMYSDAVTFAKKYLSNLPYRASSNNQVILPLSQLDWLLQQNIAQPDREELQQLIRSQILLNKN